jgi:hypothetical protein
MACHSFRMNLMQRWEQVVLMGLDLAMVNTTQEMNARNCHWRYSTRWLMTEMWGKEFIDIYGMEYNFLYQTKKKSKKVL